MILPFALAFGLLLPTFQDPTPEASTEEKLPVAPTVEEAVTVGIRLLLANQERYQVDQGAGRLDDDELVEWQNTERQRLAAVRQRGMKSAKRPNQEWPYEGVYRVGGFGGNAAIPSGYRVGGTAIVCEALLRAPGFSEDQERKAALQRSVAFVLKQLESDPTLVGKPQTSYDVRGWGHAYGLNLLLEVSKHHLVDDATVALCEAAIPDLIQRLKAGALEGGGWNYAGGECSPFMTAPTLLFLFRAKEWGYPVPEEMVLKALDALEAGRDETTGAFGYAGPRRNSMPASSGRAAIAELALLQAGRSDAEHLRRAILGFFDNWDHLFARKSQQGTHLPPYQIAPYYFFYAHAYTALAIEALPEAERPAHRDRLQELLWRTREANGGWNDRIFPRTESYSTAMSLLALLAPTLPAPATWAGSSNPKDPVGQPK